MIKPSQNSYTIRILRRYLQIRRDKSDGIRTDAKNTTLNDIFDMWVQLKKGLKDNAFQNYQYMYNMFVYPDFGMSEITKIKRSDVRRYYNVLVDSRQLKIAIMDNVHTVLYQVFELAVEDNYLRTNPADNALKKLNNPAIWKSKRRRH